MLKQPTLLSIQTVPKFYIIKVKLLKNMDWDQWQISWQSKLRVIIQIINGSCTTMPVKMYRSKVIRQKLMLKLRMTPSIQIVPKFYIIKVKLLKKMERIQ